MFVTDDGASGPTVIYSASDLAAAARCEYALLRSFDAQLGRGPAVSSDDELLARTAQLGGDHEQRHLEDLRADCAVTVIGRPTYTAAGLTTAAEATLEAVQRRDPAIYQAAMFDGRFAGFADFLIWDGQHYRLQDTKLSRSVKSGGAAPAGRLRRCAVDRRGAGRRRGRPGPRRRRDVQLPRRRTAGGVPATAHRATGACSTATSPPVPRCAGPTTRCGRVSAAVNASSRSAPPATCSWWPGFGPASAPGSSRPVSPPPISWPATPMRYPELAQRNLTALRGRPACRWHHSQMAGRRMKSSTRNR